MTLVLICFVITAVLELALVMHRSLLTRSYCDGLAILLFLTTGLLLYEYDSVATVIMSILMVYRIINIERLTHRQQQADYVSRMAGRASLVLMGLQLCIATLMLVQSRLHLSATDYLTVLAVFDLLVIGVLAHTIDHESSVTVTPLVTTTRPQQELPTLTVAIPARNETADLQACLETLTKSTYLKLEILVLDDCSQNTHTPEIIRQFAHDGVRFIAGTAPPDNWLAKNHAYQQLINEANGDILLFCGVDARFEPDALRQIVETMLDKQKTMLSIIPRNMVPSRLKLEALMVQPGRYAWELVLPRRWVDRPPVLSTCWVVQKAVVQQAGGMAAVKRAIVPERYFARYAATHQDGYSFLQAGDNLGLASAKRFYEQRATAVRIRYPGLHRRIELTAGVSLLELALLVAPYVALLYSLATRQTGLTIMFGGCCALLTYIYVQVVRITYQQRLLRSFWLLPFATLYDVGLLNYSMWQYEFSEVIWKGRNVCIPIMRVIPRLPALEPAFNHRRHRKHRHQHH